MEGVIRATGDGVTLTVRVIPRAAQSKIDGVRDGALLVRLNAPPVEGAANAELVALVSETLAVPRRAVSIALGERSRHKTIRVRGVSIEDARARLTRAR